MKTLNLSPRASEELFARLATQESALRTCRPDCCCPNCDSEMAALWNGSPHYQAAWSRRTQERLAAKVGMILPPRADTFVTAADDTDEQLKRMADFRQSVYDTANTMRAAADTPATSRVHLEPPDPYEPHLARLRKELMR